MFFKEYLTKNNELKIVGDLHMEKWMDEMKRIYSTEGCCPTLRTVSGGNTRPKILVSDNPLKIRELSSLEYWRLMGFDDKDYYKCKKIGLSDAQLYKQAGNSIVVNVLEATFRNLLI